MIHSSGTRPTKQKQKGRNGTKHRKQQLPMKHKRREILGWVIAYSGNQKRLEGKVEACDPTRFWDRMMEVQNKSLNFLLHNIQVKALTKDTSGEG